MSEADTKAIKKKAARKRVRRTLRGSLRAVTAERDAARRSASAWKKLAKAWREHAKYALEKPTLGANVRNWLLYCTALKHLTKIRDAVRAVQALDDGHATGYALSKEPDDRLAEDALDLKRLWLAVDRELNLHIPDFSKGKRE